jgi:hypothetical protein
MCREQVCIRCAGTGTDGLTVQGAVFSARTYSSGKTSHAGEQKYSTRVS